MLNTFRTHLVPTATPLAPAAPRHWQRFRPCGLALAAAVTLGLAAHALAKGINVENAESDSAVRFSLTAGTGNGTLPQAPLLEGSGGVFYGSCAFGATNNSGAIFQMNSSGALTTLINFRGSNGANPKSGLIFGPGNNLYGTTEHGGPGSSGGLSGNGTVFMVVPNGASSTLTTLWSFTGGNDGASPGDLILGGDGKFYGATSLGGQSNNGVIYELTPNGTNSTLTSLWTFSGGSDGSNPVSLVSAGSGVFYGTTFAGGSGGSGTVFKFVADGASSTLTTIATFNGFNGSGPGSLVLGSDGSYYGMTVTGGANEEGTIFSVTPAGVITTLVTFNGANGAQPLGGLLLASDGNFYGTTLVGGTNNGGTLFRMTPGGTLTTLVNFNPSSGTIYWPESLLIEASNHVIYGETYGSGAGVGNIFSVTLNGATTSVSDLVDFSPGNWPSVASIPTVTVTTTTANVQGLVNCNGRSTSAKFELSTTTEETGLDLVNAISTSFVSVGTGTTPVTVTGKYTGLTESTDYYFLIYAQNTLGNKATSSVIPFSTTGHATIGYDALTNVTTSGAVLSGSVNPRGSACTAYFQYGPTTKYGFTSPKVSIGSGIAGVPISFTLSNLPQGTEYHYRLVGQNSKGTTDGVDQAFVTATPFDVDIPAYSELKGTALTSVFTGFLNPAVNASGNMAFYATLNGLGVTTKNNAGIWTFTGSPNYNAIATKGSNAPGVPGAVFNALNDPVMNNSNRVAFIGQLVTQAGVATSTTNSGIWSDVTGSLSLVARTGSPAPDCGGAVFSAFNQVALPNQTGAIFEGHLVHKTGLVTAANDAGLWRETTGGVVDLVTRTGTTVTINGTPQAITSLTLFPATAPTAGQSISFNQSGAFAYEAGLGKTTAIMTSLSNTPVAVTNGVPPGVPNGAFKTFTAPAINSQGHTAFQATISGLGYTAANNVGIWAEQGASGLTLVTQTGATAVGTGGAVFSKMSDVVSNDSDAVAFVGTLKVAKNLAVAATDTGIWSTTGGALHLVAREGDPAPGCGSAKFAAFQQVVLPNSNRVAFLGTVIGTGFTSTNNQGLWQIDPSGQLQLVIRSGGAVMVNGVEKVISQLDVFSSAATAGGQTRNVTDSNIFGFRAKFTDGTQGLIGAALPN